jgi:DNA polymerase-1
MHQDPSTIVLIDGYAMIYRGFHATPMFTGPSGKPTNAIYAMARFLMSLDKRLPHGFGAMMLDKGRCARRMELLPQYKAQRPPMPEELRCQIAGIRDWVAAAGWTIIEQEGIEADDLIAGVSLHREGHPVAIISYDKDLAQLADADRQVVIMQPGPGDTWSTLDRQGVIEKFGIPPEALRDYLAMVGDTADNIPGVAGVGPKTAVKLIEQFGTIDAILANPDAIASVTLREKMRAAGELLTKNRSLVKLDDVLPPEWKGVSSLHRHEPDYPRLLELCDGFGFKSLRPHIERELAARQPKPLFQPELF